MLRVHLPIKTKIAAWWLIVMGILLAICNAAFAFLVAAYNFAQSIDAYSGPSLNSFWFLIPMIGSIFAICSGISLSRKSKRAWKVAVIALVIAMICSIGVYLFLSIDIYDNYLITTIVLLIGSLIYLTPLTLIVLDRKNYFEMVRQRELKKKGNE